MSVDTMRVFLISVAVIAAVLIYSHCVETAHDEWLTANGCTLVDKTDTGHTRLDGKRVVEDVIDHYQCRTGPFFEHE